MTNEQAAKIYSDNLHTVLREAANRRFIHNLFVVTPIMTVVMVSLFFGSVALLGNNWLWGFESVAVVTFIALLISNK